MATTLSDQQPATAERGGAGAWLSLMLCLLAFAAVRIPVLYRQPPGQDDEYCAVAGWQVYQTGIPQVPYTPSRSRGSTLFRADEAFFALPPLQFYWQSLFFHFLPAEVGTAKLASAVTALLALVLVFAICRQLFKDGLVALIAVWLVSVSRAFYFPAISSRPDMLCTTAGLAAIWMLLRWQASGKPYWLVASGVLIGLGMLSHQSAAVYAVQLGVFTLVATRTWRGKFLSAAILTSVAVLVYALWLILILQYSEAFFGQFFNHLSSREGQSILARLVWPLPSVRDHAMQFYERCGPLQTVMLVTGLLVGSVLAVVFGRPTEHEAENTDSDGRGIRRAVLFCWSGSWLLVVAAGVHPAQGYWSYPAVWGWIIVAWLCARLVRSAVTVNSGRWIRAGVVGGLVGLLTLGMLPGSGVTTLVKHLRHWRDVDYNSPRFADELIATLPEQWSYAVDRTYVFDFHVAGRTVYLADNDPTAFDCTPDSAEPGAPFRADRLVLSRIGKIKGLDQQFAVEAVGELGNAADIHACHVTIYRLK